MRLVRTILAGVLAVAAMVPLWPTSVHAQTTPTEAKALALAAEDHTAYKLPPDKMARAAALYPVRMLTYLGGSLWGIVSLWLLLQLGLVARMRDRAVGVSQNRWVQGPLFLLLLMLTTTALGLPVTIYQESVQKAYGLSVQGWGSWAGDQAKGFGLTYPFAGLMVMLLFLLVRKFPRTWWAWIAGALMAVEVMVVFVTPMYVDPLFNKFEPLAKSNPALVEQLQRVVAKGDGIDIPADRMYLMKASDKVTTLNAYVTGFGTSKRVVVWDTSIAKGTTDQILFIFGHEMGHYVLGHIASGMEVSFVGIFVGCLMGFAMFQWALKRFGSRWGVTSQQDWASLGIMLLVASMVGFVAEPLGNAYSRAHEHAADVYGQEVVHGIVADPQKTGQATFQLIGENAYSYPYPAPLYQWWTGSHPAIWERAAFAKYYDPWAPGEAPKYRKK